MTRALCVAALALLAGAASASSARALSDLNAPLMTTMRRAETARVVRLRDAGATLEGAPPGSAGTFEEADVLSEGRATMAWRWLVIQAVTAAIQQTQGAGPCRHEASPRYPRFGIQFVRENHRSTFVVHPRERCFEMFFDRRFEGSALPGDGWPRFLAILKQAFPDDSTVQRLDESGAVPCDDFLREHPDVAETLPTQEEQEEWPDPLYPRRAIAARVQGTVLVAALVDRDGHVRATKVLRSIALLDSAAVAAVRQWRFTPGLDCRGRPIEAWVTAPIKFTLR